MAALAALSLLSLACSPKPVQTARKQIVPVTAAIAVQKTVPVELRLIGTGQPFTNISVKAQIGGELVRVHFTEGQDVKKGDPLFQIDPRPYQQAVSQAEAMGAKYGNTMPCRNRRKGVAWAATNNAPADK